MSMLMVIVMKATSRIIWSMESVSWLTLAKESTMDNGKMEPNMDKELICMPMEIAILVGGNSTRSMVKDAMSMLTQEWS